MQKRKYFLKTKTERSSWLILVNQKNKKDSSLQVFLHNQDILYALEQWVLFFLLKGSVTPVCKMSKIPIAKI